MKHWIGRWLMGTAFIHTMVATFQYSSVLVSVVERGVFNTVAGDPVIGAVAWSLLLGCVAMVGGFTVNELELAKVPLPKTLGLCLLALATMGAVLVPVSGFWLLFPAAITILIRPQESQPERSLSS